MTRNLSKMVNLKSLLNTLEQEKDKKRVSGSFNPEFLTCIRKWREELEKRMFPQARITAQDEKLPQSLSSLQPKVDGARTLSQLKKTSIHLIIRNINIFFSKVTFRDSSWSAYSPLLSRTAKCSHSVLFTLYDPTDCTPPGSSVHGILQARILEWIAISFSKGSSQPRDQQADSNIWATMEAFYICIKTAFFQDVFTF